MTTPKKTILFNRQKQLLSLLAELGGSMRNLDFQKLLFLYCQEIKTDPPYDFIPYHFGPFSFTSYADRRKLVERGLLAQDSECWKITDAGQSCVTELGAQSGEITDFVHQYRTLRGESLVAKAYRDHPYYGIHSEIADKVLKGDHTALQSINEAMPGPGAPGITTIGYEGRSLEAYLNILLRDGVTLLCDVRRNALSRKYGFSKKTLSRACEGVGIQYRHLPELGIVSAQRQNLHSQENYDQLFDRYEREVLPEQSSALAQINAWVQRNERVALTCFEHLASQCHRHRVANALKIQFGDDYTPDHL